MSKQKEQPKIRNPFEEYELLKTNRFNFIFPKEVGIQGYEVQNASFHHDDVMIKFRVSNETRILKTLKELEHEEAAIDFRVQILEATGVVCQDILFKQYVVNEVSFDLDYANDKDLSVRVMMKSAEQYIEYEGVHYTFDSGVTFDTVLQNGERDEILKHVEERIQSQYSGDAVQEEIKKEVPANIHVDAYMATVRYTNPCQRYIQSRFAKFMDDENRDVFAYRKSRQVGSTTFLRNIIEHAMAYDMKVLVISSDKMALTEFRGIKGSNFKQSTKLQNEGGRYDLVIITENLMYRKPYTESDVEMYITPLLLPGGKIIIELPAYVHDFYDCDDNFMPWWLDDKKVGGDNGYVEFWVDQEMNGIIYSTDELIETYRINRLLFRGHHAFYRNRWSEQMNARRYNAENQFPYSEEWWEEIGE